MVDAYLLPTSGVYERVTSFPHSILSRSGVSFRRGSKRCAISVAQPDSLYPCRIFPTQGGSLVTASLLPLVAIYDGSDDTLLVLPMGLLLAEGAFSNCRLDRFQSPLYRFDNQSCL